MNKKSLLAFLLIFVVAFSVLFLTACDVEPDDKVTDESGDKTDDKVDQVIGELSDDQWQELIDFYKNEVNSYTYVKNGTCTKVFGNVEQEVTQCEIVKYDVRHGIVSWKYEEQGKIIKGGSSEQTNAGNYTSITESYIVPYKGVNYFWTKENSPIYDGKLSVYVANEWAYEKLLAHASLEGVPETLPSIKNSFIYNKTTQSYDGILGEDGGPMSLQFLQNKGLKLATQIEDGSEKRQEEAIVFNFNTTTIEVPAEVYSDIDKFIAEQQN